MSIFSPKYTAYLSLTTSSAALVLLDGQQVRASARARALARVSRAKPSLNTRASALALANALADRGPSRRTMRCQCRKLIQLCRTCCRCLIFSIKQQNPQTHQYIRSPVSTYDWTLLLIQKMFFVYVCFYTSMGWFTHSLKLILV